MKILIVDDVALLIRSLQLMLERHGHEVLTASSGRQALERLASDTSIELVITDLVMQPVNGIDLFRLTNKIARFNDSGAVSPPPFLLLTSCEKSGDRSMWDAEMQFARQEFAAIVHKPVTEKDLIPAIDSVAAPATVDA